MSLDIEVEWTTEERGTYIATLVSALPYVKAVQKFLEDVLSADESLPRGWVKARDSKGRVYFANMSTQKSSWTHPLERAMRVVADVCHKCLELPELERDTWLRKVHATWTADAESAVAKWAPMQTEDGRTYHYHEDSKESIWEHPAEREHPPFQLMLGALVRLLEKGYVKELRKVAGKRASRSRSSTAQSSRSTRKRNPQEHSAGSQDPKHMSPKRDERRLGGPQIVVPPASPPATGKVPPIVPPKYDESFRFAVEIPSSRSSGSSGPHCTALLIAEAEELVATPENHRQERLRLPGEPEAPFSPNTQDTILNTLMSRLSTSGLNEPLEIEDLV